MGDDSPVEIRRAVSHGRLPKLCALYERKMHTNKSDTSNRIESETNTSPPILRILISGDVRRNDQRDALIISRPLVLRADYI